MMKKNKSTFISERLERISQALAKVLPATEQHPVSLHQAMRYSVLGDGKRIRPLLVYAAGEGFGASPDSLDAAACAVELIHCYSLIHDDLPAMDDDDIRRGKPSCHKAFGEATAILAGDALANLAAKVLAESELLSCEQRLNMIKVLAQTSSSSGMVGGQVLELETPESSLTIKKLEHIHNLKTGALISAAVKLGALAAGTVNKSQFVYLDKFAKNLGLAFQIQDDIDDSLSDKLHKNDKTNYVTLLGLKDARRRLKSLQQNAFRFLQQLKQNGELLQIVASYIISPCTR
jgi:geranylgeranyl pyrophosphate synthase